MQHIIKKQIINLSLDKNLDAFHIQQEASNHYWNKILPMLQKVFDDASNEDEILSVDTLEIDLGVINENEIEKENWAEEVFKKVSNHLADLKSDSYSGKKAKAKSISLKFSDQWIYYMQHGYLPWNVLQSNAAWHNKVLEAFAADSTAISNLRHLINTYPFAVKRIVFQNTDKFLQSLIETLTAENQHALLQIIDELSSLFFLTLKKTKLTVSYRVKEVKQKLREHVLQLAASGDKDLKPEKIAILILNKNFSAEQLNNKKIKTFLSKSKLDADALQKIKTENKDPDDLAKEIPTRELNENYYPDEIDKEGIYVLNAGIVLLHPFLLRFFRNLQLIKEEKFIDAFAHQKALHLFHFLATGNTNPEEHQLVIAKVLCSFPLEQPVNNFIALSNDELNEANELLSSAIQQWEILKDTSPNGLREGFLQRNGKLITKNDSLYLQIESGSIDMLLDYLPWNVSVIKLPWMKNILKVEWR